MQLSTTSVSSIKQTSNNTTSNKRTYNNKTLQMMTTKGFGLIELLVVVAIIGIIATYSIGTNSATRQKAQLAEASQLMMQSIDYARSYARQTSARTVLCAGDKDSNCQSTDWSKGWTLFTVNNVTGAANFEAVRYFAPSNTNIQFIPDTGANQSTIVVNGDGYVEMAQELVLTTCLAQFSQGVEITIKPQSSSLTPLDYAGQCS